MGSGLVDGICCFHPPFYVDVLAFPSIPYALFCNPRFKPASQTFYFEGGVYFDPPSPEL